jgi:broad specificity phosphatase PhoE
MTTFYLIRHGRTDWNDDGRYQGQADPPLNALGERQAADTTQALRGIQWSAIWSSDLQRARQTALVLSAQTGLPVRLDMRLREIHLGRWQGLQPDEIVKNDAETYSLWHTAPAMVHAPGGESLRALHVRFWRALDEYAAMFPGGTVAVFTHKVPIGLVRCSMRGQPLDAFWHWLPENTTWEIVDWPLEPAGVSPLTLEARGAH